MENKNNRKPSLLDKIRWFFTPKRKKALLAQVAFLTHQMEEVYKELYHLKQLHSFEDKSEIRNKKVSKRK